MGALPAPSDALHQISNYLASLTFADKPDYGFLQNCLESIPDDGLPPGYFAPVQPAGGLNASHLPSGDSKPRSCRFL